MQDKFEWWEENDKSYESLNVNWLYGAHEDDLLQSHYINPMIRLKSCVSMMLAVKASCQNGKRQLSLGIN